MIKLTFRFYATLLLCQIKKCLILLVGFAIAFPQIHVLVLYKGWAPDKSRALNQEQVETLLGAQNSKTDNEKFIVNTT